MTISIARRGARNRRCLSELPFGEELFAGVGGRTTGQGYVSDNTRQRYTSKERDTETGLDYFLARYYSSTQGRFTSSDPIAITSYRLVNPQALNGYSYVANSPVKFTDPTGKIIQFRNKEDAEKALALYRNGLTKGQQGAVSIEKDKNGKYVLKVDAKAAGKAGDGSVLQRLSSAATNQRVAVVNFVKNDSGFEVIKYGVASLKESTSLAKMAAETNGRVTEFAGFTLPEFGGKENPKYNGAGLNSAEPGVTRILVNTEAKSFTLTQAIYAETLSHFQIFAETGNARQAVHPRVDVDEESIVNEVGANEKANRKKP